MRKLHYDGRVKLLTCIIQGDGGVSDLLARAVDAVGSQQVDGLLHQVRAAAAEHAEAQVLQELCFSGGSIQSPGGADAVIRSEGQKAQDSHGRQCVLRQHYLIAAR